MSEMTERRSAPREIVGLYLAGAAIFGGIAAVFYHPARIGLASIAVALVASAMTSDSRYCRFAGISLAVATIGWLGGMIVGIMLDRAIF